MVLFSALRSAAAMLFSHHAMLMPMVRVCCGSSAGDAVIFILPILRVVGCVCVRLPRPRAFFYDPVRCQELTHTPRLSGSFGPCQPWMLQKATAAGRRVAWATQVSCSRQTRVLACGRHRRQLLSHQLSWSVVPLRCPSVARCLVGQG